jgi:hypothetical protein
MVQSPSISDPTTGVHTIESILHGVTGNDRPVDMSQRPCGGAGLITQSTQLCGCWLATSSCIHESLGRVSLDKCLQKSHSLTHNSYATHLVKMQAAPVDPAELRFMECLCNVLRFTVRQIHVLHDDGDVLTEDLAYWSYEDISSWASHKEKLRADAGGSPYGDMKRKNLIALSWWITERVSSMFKLAAPLSSSPRLSTRLQRVNCQLTNLISSCMRSGQSGRSLYTRIFTLSRTVLAHHWYMSSGSQSSSKTLSPGIS